ncbi:metal ABC transporter ATP-binding protein [Aeribacillus pallidus]|uniref:Zinc ABC transporter ATP-binding protein n=1 Tax=Aeribacillus pallidus TaxID=33936 RepID=A0A165XQU0_9BACI|nr:metal ABC transporter ATP-binding protein [Aeribacillus pallidus]KZN96304.1 zinc ABC transporter ATP-binding protein [Aeribacillus pallidus]
MGEKIVEVKNLFFQYERKYVLENINISIEKGAFLGLVGPNGSGKSTLLKCLLGLLKPQKGTIHLFGEDIHQFNDWHKIGYVSQKANSFNSSFPATVFEVVASGLTPKLGLLKKMKKADREKVMEAIRAVGMEKAVHQNIGELSGGQQQRVFIARALVSEPKLLILDEPTVGVDSQTVNHFYQLLHHLNKELEITLILVTHDIGAITDKVTHVACLNKQLYFHGNKDEFERLKETELTSLYGHPVQLITHDHE